MEPNDKNQQQTYNPHWVGQKTDKGPTRPANEDALWVPNETTPVALGALYVVADGVGGQRFGADASKLAAEKMDTVFYRQRQLGEPIAVALRQAIQGANIAIYGVSQERQVQRMGSTIVAAVQDKHKLHVANVGDARAYLLRGNKLRQLTSDDTWVQRQVEAGILTPEEAAKHELRNVVTQVLGNKPEIDIHSAPVETLQPGDMLLLCSDGVYDAVSADQMINIMNSYPAAEAAPKLIEAATIAQASDNITAVILAPDIIPIEEEDEPTVVVAPPPLKPPPPAAARSAPPAAPAAKRPSTMTILIGVLLAILLIGAATVAILNFTAGNPDILLNDGTDTPTTEPTTLPTIQPTAVQPTTPPTFTPEATPTIAAPEAITATQSIPPTATIATEAAITTEEPALPQGCTIEFAFVWRDEQINSNQCTHTTSASLQPNETVFIIDGNVRSVNGPDSSCTPHQFIKIRSQKIPTVEGWVFNSAINRAACEP